MKINIFILCLLFLIILGVLSYFSFKCVNNQPSIDTFIGFDSDYISGSGSICEPGHELYYDKKTKKIECTPCKAGTYSPKGGKCRACPKRHWSEQGAKVCKQVIQCEKGYYDDIEINDIDNSLLEELMNNKISEIQDIYPTISVTDETKKKIKKIIKNKIKYNVSNYVDKKSNINCKRLDICDKTKFSTNYDSNYIFDHTGTPGVASNKQIYMNNYECKDLQKCEGDTVDKGEYWSNWHMTSKGNKGMGYHDSDYGMYTTDRECTYLTNCNAGSYYDPNILDMKDGLPTMNRECNKCEGSINNPSYTDKPNQHSCIPQTKCSAGEYLDNQYMIDNNTIVTDKSIAPGCTSCSDYTYTDEPNFAHKCEEQSKCLAGSYDIQKPPTNEKRQISDCANCECDTYTDGLSHVTKCEDQPIITKMGIGSIDYIGKDEFDQGKGKCTTNRRMEVEDCDGDTNYQNEKNHRNACKEHITCDPGELISPINPIQTRSCKAIPECKQTDCVYMPYVTHRVQEGLPQPNCGEGSVLNPPPGKNLKTDKGKCIDLQYKLTSLLESISTVGL